MTVEETVSAVVEVPKEEVAVTGEKRSFEEIQARAITIHDLEDEDEVSWYYRLIVGERWRLLGRGC